MGVCSFLILNPVSDPVFQSLDVLLASSANPVIARGCLTGKFIPALAGEVEHSATLRERKVVGLLGVNLIADRSRRPLAGQNMACEQPDLDFLPSVLRQECSVSSHGGLGLLFERVENALAVGVAVAIDTKQVQVIDPRMAADTPIRYSTGGSSWFSGESRKFTLISKESDPK